MSAVIELEDKKTEVTSNGNDAGTIKPYLFTVKVYDEMIKKGILTENDNVELLNGRIVKKMPKGTKHTSVNTLITKYFYKNLNDETVIRVQDPIWLDGITEPEPDLALARFNSDNYSNGHPKPKDILLLIEVSDTTLNLDKNVKSKMYASTTLNLDKNVKSKMYASAGIVQYLVVDVIGKLVIDYREPSEDDYQTKQTYKIGDKFSLVEFPNIEIAVEDFFKS